jgi:hypothetical protein
MVRLRAENAVQTCCNLFQCCSRVQVDLHGIFKAFKCTDFCIIGLHISEFGNYIEGITKVEYV